MGKDEHQEYAAVAFEKLRCVVVVVSNTRTIETDESGKTIKEFLVNAGHEVVYLDVIKNEYEAIQDTLLYLLNQDIHAIFFTGGTGMGKNDITIETVTPFLEKRVEGFGELFRSFSYEKIGPSAMMSRAVLGMAKERLISCLPGSKDAVDLAMEKLLLPELKHLMWVITK